MNKKNIKALALASIFSLSLASGKFNQNKVCAGTASGIFKIIFYGGLGFISGMAFQKYLDSMNKPVNNDINHDNNTDLPNLLSTNNKQTGMPSNIPFLNILSNNNKQTMAFPNIPFLKWQDGNCFFLAVLYTLYAPENIHNYQLVSVMTTELAAHAYADYARSFGKCQNAIAANKKRR